MEKLFKEMKKKIEDNTVSRSKSAALHALVIIHAGSLKHADPYEVASQLGLRPSFHTEIRKALNTAAMLDEMGHRIVEKV